MELPGSLRTCWSTQEQGRLAGVTGADTFASSTLGTSIKSFPDSQRPKMTMRIGLMAALLVLSGCDPTAKPPREVSVPRDRSVQKPGPVVFEDVSQRIGLGFVHDSSAKGAYFMPEQTGSGAALFDYDNDGRLDVYLVQCGGPGSLSRNQLYHQEAHGLLRNASAGSGLDVVGYGMGATVGDVNNDGWSDVLVTEYGAARLFLNRGSGSFEEVTKNCGVENSRWATAASFFDFDRDGWLDLVVANYLDYGPTHRCNDANGTPEYCGPQNFPGTVTRLFHNVGSGAKPGGALFEDVTVSSGLTRAAGPALGLLCADFDGDRWPDIFLADDGRPNRLFINQKNGAFVEEAAQRGLAFNAMGGTAGNMGVAPGDVDGDGLFDIFVTHLAEEQHALWAQGPRGLFLDQTSRVGLANPAWRGTGFGAVLADYNQDGWLDLALVNGLVRRGHDTATPRLAGLAEFWKPYAQRSQLFLNNGSGRFLEVSLSNPAFSGEAIVGRGLACGDYDQDGAPDLLVTSTGGPARLFRNVAPQRGHWLWIRAVDPALGGRDAYGAEVVVSAGTRTWWRLVQPSYSYLVSNDPRAHFGLGAVQAVDSILVRWPDGADESFPGTAVDRTLVLRKGMGTKP